MLKITLAFSVVVALLYDSTLQKTAFRDFAPTSRPYPTYVFALSGALTSQSVRKKIRMLCSTDRDERMTAQI
jgi:hypothetical protein